MRTVYWKRPNLISGKHSPARFGHNHFSPQFVEFIPQRLHLQLSLNRGHERVQPFFRHFFLLQLQLLFVVFSTVFVDLVIVLDFPTRFIQIRELFRRRSASAATVAFILEFRFCETRRKKLGVTNSSNGLLDFGFVSWLTSHVSLSTG